MTLAPYQESREDEQEKSHLKPRTPNKLAVEPCNRLTYVALDVENELPDLALLALRAASRLQ